MRSSVNTCLHAISAEMGVCVCVRALFCCRFTFEAFKLDSGMIEAQKSVRCEKQASTKQFRWGAFYERICHWPFCADRKGS